MEIVLEDGKYIYRCADNGRQTVHRYGELWRDFTGDKFIYRMAAKIEQLQDENAALKEELVEAMRVSVLCAKAHENEDAENEKLVEQLAAAQKDAERYRWLRDHDNDLWIAMIEAIKVGGEAMEAAIDAAMQGAVK